jgi:hypothetical protein
MTRQELMCLFDQLSEADQKAACEFIRSLAHRSGEETTKAKVSKVYGKNFYVVSD